MSTGATPDGVRVSRESYKDPLQSINAIARFVVGHSDEELKELRGAAIDMLAAAGIDGRSGHTIRDKAQALRDAVVSVTTFVPDPIKKELVVSPLGLLCLRKNLCVRGGDCDDVTALVLALLEVIGIVTWIVRQDFGPGKQEHVLGGAQDENGELLYLDCQHKEQDVTTRNRGVVRETLYDPHEVHKMATGESKGAEIVTFGAAPVFLDRGHARVLRHDGMRWWEKRRAGWFVEESGRFVRADARVSDASFRGLPATGFGAVGDRVEPNPGGETANRVRAEAAGSELAQALFTIRSAAIGLESALDSYEKTRVDLSMPTFDATTPATVRGPAEFTYDPSGRVVWSPGVVEYGRWLVKVAKYLASLADGALQAERQIAFSDSADILIQALSSDPVRLAIAGTMPGARTISFNGPDGVTLWTMDENGNRSTAAPPVGVGALPVIAIVAIVVVCALALYFIISKICDAVKTSIDEKASATILECVQSGRCTADQGKALLQADADRRAAILKAQTDKDKADPFASVVETGASVVKWLIAGAGVVGAVMLGSAVIPRIQEWRAGVPKKVPAEANEGGSRELTRAIHVEQLSDSGKVIASGELHPSRGEKFRRVRRVGSHYEFEISRTGIFWTPVRSTARPV